MSFAETVSSSWLLIGINVWFALRTPPFFQFKNTYQVSTFYSPLHRLLPQKRGKNYCTVSIKNRKNWILQVSQNIPRAVFRGMYILLQLGPLPGTSKAAGQMCPQVYTLSLLGNHKRNTPTTNDRMLQSHLKKKKKSILSELSNITYAWNLRNTYRRKNVISKVKICYLYIIYNVTISEHKASYYFQ